MALTLTQTPNSEDTNRSTATWTNVANAYDSSTTTLATLSITQNPSISIVKRLGLNGFNFANIPNGSKINNITVTVYQSVSSPTNRFASVGFFFWANGNSVGSGNFLTLSSNSNNSDTVTVSGLTLNDLKASDFAFVFEVGMQTGTATGTSSFGYVSMTVDYSVESWGSLYL